MTLPGSSESPIVHAVIAANGRYSHPERQTELVRQADVVIAADGGSSWLYARSLRADLVVGDLDSVSPTVIEALQADGARLVRHPRRKDETDTELALLEAVRLGARRITLLGATGGRIDHTLANVLLLAMPELRDVQAHIFDGRSFVSLVRTEVTIQGEPGDIVSLIPLGSDAEGVCSVGLEYPLQGETLRFGPARGISNVLTNKTARVTLRRGILVLVHTPARYLEE